MTRKLAIRFAVAGAVLATVLGLLSLLSSDSQSAGTQTSETVCSVGSTGFGALPTGTVVTVAPTKPGTVACWVESHH